MSDLDTQLEDLEAQLLALQTETPEQEETRKRREVADKQALIKAIKEVGPVGKKIHGVYTPDGIVIVRKPAAAVWRTAHALPTAHERNDQVVYACLVHPSADQYRQLEQEYPQLPANLYAACSLLAGLMQESTAAKL
jgi:hypothetical protein